MFQNLRYTELDAFENVFDYGDDGELFYIIMEGEVKIKIPAPDELEEEQCTPEGVLIFVVEYFGDIHWANMRHGLEIRNMILNFLSDH